MRERFLFLFLGNFSSVSLHERRICTRFWGRRKLSDDGEERWGRELQISLSFLSSHPWWAKEGRKESSSLKESCALSVWFRKRSLCLVLYLPIINDVLSPLLVCVVWWTFPWRTEMPREKEDQGGDFPLHGEMKDYVATQGRKKHIFFGVLLFVLRYEKRLFPLCPVVPRWPSLLQTDTISLSPSSFVLSSIIIISSCEIFSVLFCFFLSAICPSFLRLLSVPCRLIFVRKERERDSPTCLKSTRLPQMMN